MVTPISSGTPHGADSEVGRLATVMLHRPGNELKRLTPRNNDRLLFDGIPWVSRAQEEHDAFAETLRNRGVEVLYLTELLTETLDSEIARNHAITSALSCKTHRLSTSATAGTRNSQPARTREVASNESERNTCATTTHEVAHW